MHLCACVHAFVSECIHDFFSKVLIEMTVSAQALQLTCVINGHPCVTELFATASLVLLGVLLRLGATSGLIMASEGNGRGGAGMKSQ